MAEELRRSQLITTFGVGAITDMKEFSGVLKSPDVWGACDVPIAPLIAQERIEEPRLAKRLKNNAINSHLEYFLMPPRARENLADSLKLPFTLFPRMLYCKKCGRMKLFEEWFPQGLRFANHLRCNERRNGITCNGKLVPSRFITICPKGHLDDFPYSAWIHNYKECQNPNLQIRFQGGSSSLSSIQLKCTTCNQTRSMANALNTERHHEDFVCRGNRPELYRPNIPLIEGCGVAVRHFKFVLRNAANVYYPKIYSSISIPPFASQVITEISVSPELQTMRNQRNEGDEEQFLNNFNYNVTRWARIFQKPLELIENLLRNFFDESEDLVDEESYRFAEYNSFLNEPDIEQTDFVIERMNLIDELKYIGVEQIVKVVRLREVRVLTGYSRVRPYDLEMPLDGHDQGDVAAVMRSEFKKIVNNDNELRLRFLPGIETFGEGIFLSFSNQFMAGLEQKPNVVQRVNIVNQNMTRNVEDGGREIPLNARYVALHTLAHLLIKRLSFDSGYSIASIRERLYCNMNPINNMNAMLLYTVDTDSEGTMGGLCRLADPKELHGIIKIALEESEWCSSDPVCRESTGQGLGSLNLAACHSCCLLPETSCESGNRLLDRTIMDYYFCR